MKNVIKSFFFLATLATLFVSCTGGSQESKDTTQTTENMFTGAKGEVKLMNLDPGHFHAALVQKSMYEQMDPKVHVFAPEGSDVDDYMTLINGYNTRSENPTSWDQQIYKGPDYLEKMLSEKPGNVMVTAGNNKKKTEYILKTVQAGINVLADKPMVITKAGFSDLEKAFEEAEKNGVLLYDIMTERHEITTIIQRELAKIPSVFGELTQGTPDAPAITKESVHHFFKYVSGNPIKRPAWFFDTQQQGEGIVDVNTHLVDLIQWEAFPDVILNKSDVEIISARRWPTELTLEQFTKVTQLDAFPDYLQKDIKDGKLQVYANGEIIYKLKGKVAKASVIWNYQAPEGTGDTHYSIMRGSKCNIIIKQGKEEGFKPTVYVESSDVSSPFRDNLQEAIDETIGGMYPGVTLEQLEDNLWTINIPAEYKVGHEAHFGQVTEKYLKYLVDGKLPEWEVPNMITKYYTTTLGLEKAME
ncbi:MAG: oxidoreductase [Cyclobacteriaceae bacterium]|nr:oxidoreductase [Cyclobacteriaceae bacterium SS2]